MKILQFEGRLYHENCFDSFLSAQRAKQKFSSDWKPKVEEKKAEDLNSDDACEECSGVFQKEDSVVDTEARTRAAASIDVDDDDKDDDVDTTPPPSPIHRRRR